MPKKAMSRFIFTLQKPAAMPDFWMSPVRLSVNHGFRPHDLSEIAGIIEEHETLILEKWNEFFRP